MKKTAIYVFHLVLFVLMHNMLSAQQKEILETLSKVSAYYKAQAILNLEMEYKMFMGYDGKQPTESYKGTLYKNGEVTQVKILGSEVLHFPQAQIAISEENKTLFYNKIDQPTEQNLPTEVASFLKFYEATSLNHEGNILIVELKKKPNPLTIPYSKITLYINQNSYAIDKEVMFLATKVPFVDKDGKDVEDVGRIEVTFSSVFSSSEKMPKLEDYVILGPNNQVELAKAFKDYTILDQTKL